MYQKPAPFFCTAGVSRHAVADVNANVQELAVRLSVNAKVAASTTKWEIVTDRKEYECLTFLTLHNGRAN